MGAFLEKEFRIKDLKTKSTWIIHAGPESKDKLPYKKTNRRGKHTEEKVLCRKGTETGMICPQVKKCQGLPAATCQKLGLRHSHSEGPNLGAP